MNEVAQDITSDLTRSSSSSTSRDWGIEPNESIDAQFKSDLREIREAELSAERNAVSLRVF